ncbi:MULTISPECIES: ADP-ribosylglycohydrolase family protein [unclassified Streptomyces]|uniref:ADP-ribosylglycohydrolase family protein n=1 Tax=unclassified Streptomyces TaxID=2593676 RepID=UPI003815D572
MSTPSGSIWGRVEQQDFRSRVRGALLGGAVGDALGAGVSTLTLEEIRAAHGPGGVLDFVPAYGRRGGVTAATQLTLFTVDGLIRAHVRRDTGAWHPPTDVHRAHQRWAATQRDWGPDLRRKDNGWLAQEEWLYTRRDPTISTLTGLGDEAMGTLDSPKNPIARDSGALVRSAPFGLLVGWEPQLVSQLALECAVQTHGSPGAYFSAGSFAVIVHALARGETLETGVRRTLEMLAPRLADQPVSEALQQALDAVRQGVPGPDRIVALGEGRTAESALAVAVYCGLVAEDVRHGLRLAVNHDGPSAATGSLAGAILGALHGETALPPAWLAELEGRPTILEIADDFAMEMTQGRALHTPEVTESGWLTRYPRG